MGIMNVMVWIEVQKEDEALDVSEQISELIDAQIVRPGVQLRGITQERPEAACGLACDGSRRLQGTIDGEPNGDIYVITPGGQRIGILEFLRQSGGLDVKSTNGLSIDGVIIKLEAGPPASACESCSTNLPR